MVEFDRAHAAAVAHQGLIAKLTAREVEQVNCAVGLGNSQQGTVRAQRDCQCLAGRYRAAKQEYPAIGQLPARADDCRPGIV